MYLPNKDEKEKHTGVNPIEIEGSRGKVRRLAVGYYFSSTSPKISEKAAGRRPSSLGVEDQTDRIDTWSNITTRGDLKSVGSTASSDQATTRLRVHGWIV